MHKPRPQEIYRHFKGRYYQIVTLATDSESGEEMVVYQAMYGDFAVYCRPLWMFLESLDTVRYPDADQTYRFQLVQPEHKHARRRREHHHTEPESPGDIPKRDAAREEKARQQIGIMSKSIEEEAEELNLDPRVVAFLDADSPDKRLRILDDMHTDITDDQIDICAMALDAKIPMGDTLDRYHSLRDLLMTRKRFESNRLRGGE